MTLRWASMARLQRWRFTMTASKFTAEGMAKGCTCTNVNMGYSAPSRPLVNPEVSTEGFTNTSAITPHTNGVKVSSWGIGGGIRRYNCEDGSQLRPLSVQLRAWRLATPVLLWRWHTMWRPQRSAGGFVSTTVKMAHNDVSITAKKIPSDRLKI